MKKPIITEFPEEILYHIFSFLSKSDLLSCGATCKRFNEISVDDRIWRIFTTRYLNLHRFPVPNNLNELANVKDKFIAITREHQKHRNYVKNNYFWSAIEEHPPVSPAQIYYPSPDAPLYALVGFILVAIAKIRKTVLLSLGKVPSSMEDVLQRTFRK